MLFLTICLVVVLCVSSDDTAAADSKGNAKVGDAYVRADGLSWKVGTKAVEMTYELNDGLLIVDGFKNKLTKKACEYASKTSVLPAIGSPDGNGKWVLGSATASQETLNGRPVVQLAVELTQKNTKARFHAVAYPGTSVIRQWVELENTGSAAFTVPSNALSISMAGDSAVSYTNYWMIGGNSVADQGMMHSAPVTKPYHQTLNATSTSAFMPWMAFMRKDSSADGWFFALEYLGTWRISVDSEAVGPANIRADVTDLDAVQLAPGQKIKLPMVTIGTFAGSLDDMAARSYDWQYQYMWDYTNMDYYAKPKWALPWIYCVQNLQEQFGERLAFLDMDADKCRDMGFDMLWDDAGWSMYPTMPDDSYGNVFSSGYESPDFAQSLRYLKKMDLRWLAWFVGRPSPGVMDTKVGAWGDFEWRTDGVGFPDWASDGDLRDKIEHFLDNHPGCSFHTCSGGSHYSHTYEIQRYANTNYFSDFGRGDQTNYYFSYIEPPDKWTDIIEPALSKGVYRPELARQTLTMVPFWFFYANGNDPEYLRKDLEIYRYMLREGIAGRWSYMFHPAVKGDIEYYYNQRTSHDRTKACIIIKHKAPGKVTICPRELLPEHKYVVGLDSSQDTTVRTGADLMAKGIVIKDMPAGELIWIGLPDRPGCKGDSKAPAAPGNVLVRRETNIGHSGVGIYWSAGIDNNWISFYEVSRDGKVLGKASVGTYYFDHSAGYNPDAKYEVRAVDGSGNVSPWTAGKAVDNDPITAYALGGLFSEPGRDGWYAETTTDGKNYFSMQVVKPASTSAADLGGSPNKPGGVEGYWEGPAGAHIGRAWQQASTNAACIRTWVAPIAGSVRIVSRVMKEYYRQDKGQPLNVKIMQNDNQIWPASGWATVPLNNVVGLVHNLTVNVAAGDTIRFVLDKGTDPASDIIGWMPRIVYNEDTKASDRGSVVRILCGSKTPYTDRTGNVWSEDKYFKGGKSLSTKIEIAGASPTLNDQPLYQSGREGKDFTYSIPAKPGLYAIRLKFAEPKYQWIYQRPFNVSVNGHQKLHDFDICQDARGYRKAHERVFRYIVPNAEGNIVLRFTGGQDPVQETDNAMVQAIEIIPEIKPVVRINCGSDTDFVDWDSFIWTKDQNLDKSQMLTSTAPVAQASPTPLDQALYQTARTGKSLVYKIEAAPGLYSVHLKFAELWLTEPGKRPMDIEINGQLIRKSWDPAAAAGQTNMSADIRAENLTPDSKGLITIQVTAAGKNDAILQGIEVE